MSALYDLEAVRRAWEASGYGPKADDLSVPMLVPVGSLDELLGLLDALERRGTGIADSVRGRVLDALGL